MTERSPILQEYLDTVQAAIRARAPAGGKAEQAAERIFGALARPAPSGARNPVRLPCCTHLEAAFTGAERCPPEALRVARAFATVEPGVTWVRRGTAAAIGEPFFSGHANALVVGPGGLEPRQDVWVGVSLVSPGVTYPDHTHPPEEVYVVLSQGSWRQKDGPWHEPGLGGIVYNPPGIVHAMRAGAEPLLATWCLWVG